MVRVSLTSTGVPLRAGRLIPVGIFYNNLSQGVFLKTYWVGLILILLIWFLSFVLSCFFLYSISVIILSFSLAILASKSFGISSWTKFYFSFGDLFPSSSYLSFCSYYYCYFASFLCSAIFFFLIASSFFKSNFDLNIVSY